MHGNGHSGRRSPFFEKDQYISRMDNDSFLTLAKVFLLEGFVDKRDKKA